MCRCVTQTNSSEVGSAEVEFGSDGILYLTQERFQRVV